MNHQSLPTPEVLQQSYKAHSSVSQTATIHTLELNITTLKSLTNVLYPHSSIQQSHNPDLYKRPLSTLQVLLVEVLGVSTTKVIKAIHGQVFNYHTKNLTHPNFLHMFKKNLTPHTLSLCT